MKMKKFVSLILSGVILTSCIVPAYAGYEKTIEAANSDPYSFEQMSDGISSLDLIQVDLSDKVIYTYEQNDKTYKVEETLQYNNDTTEIESKIYEETSTDKYLHVGTLNTTVNSIPENSAVELTVEQNNKVVSHDIISTQTINVNNETPSESSVNPTATYPIYEWRYQGVSYGNTKILRYTVSAIITALATAVGFKTAGKAGTVVANVLADIAKNVILDKIQLVYWKRNLWYYYMNNSITWHYVGDKKKVWFYSDANRTNLINYVEEVDI